MSIAMSRRHVERPTRPWRRRAYLAFPFTFWMIVGHVTGLIVFSALAGVLTELLP